DKVLGGCRRQPYASGRDTASRAQGGFVSRDAPRRGDSHVVIRVKPESEVDRDWDHPPSPPYVVGAERLGGGGFADLRPHRRAPSAPRPRSDSMAHAFTRG